MVDIDDNTKSSRNRIQRIRKELQNRKQGTVGPRSSSGAKGIQQIVRIPIQSLAHTLGLSVSWVRWDRTAHGWHVVIKVREKLTLAETIAAQAILGSDPARERLNLARCISLRKKPSKYWEARANILYSRKAER